MTAPALPSLDNIQGIIVRPYTHPWSRHLLLHIDDAASGRSLMSALAPLVTPATDWGTAKPATLLNLGITCNGLHALGIQSTIVNGNYGINGFPVEFTSSCTANPDSGGTASFIGASDPNNWWSGADAKFTSSDIHLVVHLYALDGDGLERLTARVRGMFSTPGVTELLPMAGGKPIDGARLPDDTVHFGYRDGISQPNVAWPGMTPLPDAPVADFRDFLLGYPNAGHPSAPRTPFARDGSYLVFQLVYQDSAYFNRLLESESAKLPVTLPVPDKKEWLAAKLVGRWRSGAPLVEAPLADDPSKAMNTNFGYAADPNGTSCPFSAHVRVVNPRDQQVDALVQPVPPLIRRGVPYGPPLEGDVDDGVDRGLVGIFICASISRQYLKAAKWMNRNDFSPVFQDPTTQDPIQGNRQVPQCSTSFRIPVDGNGGDIVLQGLNDLVKTTGAAFCFLPSLSTIKGIGAGAFSDP